MRPWPGPGVDGWIWVFVLVDHSAAEAWAHVAKTGDRFAALQPADDAVIDRFGGLEANIARGLWLRHGWGPQYRSAHLPAHWRGWASATTRRSWASRRPMAALSGASAPSKTSACGSGCTDTVDELRQAVAGFVDRCNTSWRIQATGTGLQRRPTRQHHQPQRHDRTDHESLQGTECCSGIR